MTLGNSTETKIEDTYSMPTGINEETQRILREVSDLVAKGCKIRLSPEYLMKKLFGNKKKVGRLQKILALHREKPDEDTEKQAQEIFDMIVSKKYKSPETGRLKEVIRGRRDRVYTALCVE